MGKIKKGLKQHARASGLLLLFAIALAASAAVQNRHVQAAANDVVINEIMYNPQSDIGGDEFLELYNRTANPIDLGGWCFSGITLCFSPGVIIGANGYLLISPNSSLTLATYSVATAATYTGGLSNSGETISLLDNTATLVNSVTYGQDPPWPTSPDGSGPSLELKGTGLDNSVATNWGASLNAPTPGVQNSYIGIVLPTVSSVTEPVDITEGEAVTVTANVQDATSVNLSYKVNFAGDTTVPMLDDGASGDGAASDGVYAATIPGQSIGDLIRFKVTASAAGGDTLSPSVDDSQNYHGYVIADTSVTSNAPILNWYMSDAEYEDMYQNHVYDNQYFSTVVVYGDTVFDNAEVRIKGDISRNHTKKSFKFKLPAGYAVDIAGGSDRAINEFHMNASMNSETMGYLPMAWWAVEQSGLTVADVIPTRLQRNNDFQGMYVFAEKYEREWREEYGFDDGELFENAGEIVSGANNFTNLDAYKNALGGDYSSSALRDNILDNTDVPNVNNYMSVNAILNTWDVFADWNSFIYYDKADTKRWSMLHWDLDSALSSDNTQISPYDYYGETLGQSKFTTTSLYAQKDLRMGYFRRLRTLVDKLYGNDELLNKYQEISDLHEADMELDVAKWPADETSGRAARIEHETQIARIKTNLLAYQRQPWALPAAQTQEEKESVYLDEVVDEIDNADEYIKISNTSSSYVDISGWVVEGIDYTIPAGSVVPANGSIYLLRDDDAYRVGHSSVLVAGQYTTDLNDLGNRELILKTDTNQTIDSHAY